MMHFNFHLTGDESPEQTRRVANAVLALGGLVNNIDEPEFTYEEFGGPVTIGKREPIMPRFVGGISDPEATQLTEDDLPLNPPPPYTEAEQFAGALTSEEIRAVESLPPASPDPQPSETDEMARSDFSNGNFSKGTGLDKNGLPWDERIHSSSRAINADGTWRYRKNVPDENKQAVEAELRGLVQAPQLTEADLPLAAPPVPVPPIPTAGRAAYNEALNEAAAHGQLPPPVPVSLVQRSYSDVVNLIMANQETLNKPELYVSVLGMSLPEFAAACIAKPELATAAFNALDEIRRS